jgi:hypothetical protein
MANLTPLGLMIGPLNQLISNSAVVPQDAAEDILERLRVGGYLIICASCGRDWTDYCKCSLADV